MLFAQEEYPYRMLADSGVRDLLDHGGAKIQPSEYSDD